MATFPNTPVFDSLTIRSFAPSFESVSHSLKRKVLSMGGQRWLMEATFPAMTRAEFAPLYAFSLKQDGRTGTFDIVPPQVATPQGVGTGSPVVNGAGQTGNSIITDGWTPSQTGILKAGDYFKFQNRNKVYMNVEDVNSDVSGNATLTTFPAIPSDDIPADNEVLVVSSVPFKMSFVEDLQAFNLSLGQSYGFSLNLVEVP